jgi:hypothetical protein
VRSEATACCALAAASSSPVAPASPGAAELTVLDVWRADGPVLVADHARAYRALLADVVPLISARRFHDAAAAAQVAANHAVHWHPGRFVCPDLEAIVAHLGAAALPHVGSGVAPRPDRPMSVLHVATEFYAVGGHSRMAAHWMNEDSDNRHSLALTRQHEIVPPELATAVAASRGSITLLNRTPGDLLGWARRLQRLIAEADCVILHVHSMDVIPFLALAGMAHRPPVLLVNHADHLFWLGANFVDLVVSTRASGDRLTRDRRGIPDARRAVIPLCLAPPDASMARAEARRRLGFPEDQLIILTVARALKFKRVGHEEFPDPLVPLLEANPRARLVVLGPGGQVDWSRAEAAVPGQVIAVPATPETAPYFAAADIYLDSFPFVSVTSMLEAGLRGLPLVTRQPFGPECAVMGSDSPGIELEILRADSGSGVVGLLQRLIDDAAWRRQVGARTAAAIARTHMGAAWRAGLSEVYRRGFAAHAAGPHAPVHDASVPSDLDAFVPYAYGDLSRGATPEGRLVCATETALKAAPLAWRLRTLARFRHNGLLGEVGCSPWRCLIPEWAGTNLRMLARRYSA